MSYSSLVIDVVDPRSPEAAWCVERYFAELAERFEDGFQADASIPADPSEFVPPTGVFLVGSIHGRPVACGGVTRRGENSGYIKRMWVDRRLRGLGLGRRVLNALEDAAASMGCRFTELETNGALTQAIRMYRTSGYEEVAPFNDEPYAHHWFRKRLDRAFTDPRPEE